MQRTTRIPHIDYRGILGITILSDREIHQILTLDFQQTNNLIIFKLFMGGNHISATFVNISSR